MRLSHTVFYRGHICRFQAGIFFIFNLQIAQEFAIQVHIYRPHITLALLNKYLNRIAALDRLSHYYPCSKSTEIGNFYLNQTHLGK